MKLQQSKCKEGLLFSGSTQPLVQVSLIGLVCFRCPGMFNALAGMGGGGQVKATAANNATTAQMLGSAAMGYVFDFSLKSRRTRGYVGIGNVAFCCILQL
jgi:hypothetical protein